MKMSTKNGPRRFSRRAQQGDVCLERREIPEAAAARAGLVLAEGEATGHAHRVGTDEKTDAELLELGDRVFLRVMGGDVRVVHEEHGEIIVSPGEYEVTQIREYDYETDEARVIAD